MATTKTDRSNWSRILMFRKKNLQNMNDIVKSDSTNIEKNVSTNIEKIDQINVPKTISDKPHSMLDESKYTPDVLVDMIKKLDGHTIKPFFDTSKNKITYPFLANIGLDVTDEKSLANFVQEGILEKQLHEKFIVCSEHPNSLVTSVRVYCPSCNSMNVEKLSLYEHKKCGNIIESALLTSDIKSCPFCTHEIINFEKECRIPAMWYKCEDCSEKFDNATIKLYCREHNHDFDLSAPKFFRSFSYVLKDSLVTGKMASILIKKDVSKILERFKITPKINETLQGKSGNYHEIPLYGKSVDGKTDFMMFIFEKPEGIDDTDINKILITILDLEPMITIAVTTSEIKPGTKTIMEKYNIKLVQGDEMSIIKSKVEKILSAP